MMMIFGCDAAAGRSARAECAGPIASTASAVIRVFMESPLFDSIRTARMSVYQDQRSRSALIEIPSANRNSRLSTLLLASIWLQPWNFAGDREQAGLSGVLTPVSGSRVVIADGFWAPKFKVWREVTIPGCF